MSQRSWEDSSRAMAMHDFLDLALRCRANPTDGALATRFAVEAARVGPLLVERVRTLENENERLRELESA